MPYFLPHEFAFAHDFCFYLHDMMANIIKEGETRHDFWVKLHVDAQEQEQIRGLTGDKLFRWMLDNGHQRAADLFTYKQVFAATLSDFLQFVFSALQSSEKGHLSVAFSLLRKPFKDNLLVLERLLAEPEKFIEAFNSERSVEEIAIDRFSAAHKQRIIRGACRLIPVDLNQDDFLYGVRYSKKAQYGFEPLWQKATHIITTNPHFMTEPGNLNFVFSSSESKIDQWRRLYSLLPTLLVHSLQVSYSAFRAVVADDEFFEHEPYQEDAWSRVWIGHALSTQPLFQAHAPDLQDALAAMSLPCQQCGVSVQFSDSMTEQVVNEWSFLCPNGHISDFFGDPDITK